jgi:hypothetical protein
MRIAPLPAAVANALAQRHNGARAGSHFIPNHEGDDLMQRGLNLLSLGSYRRNTRMPISAFG